MKKITSLFTIAVTLLLISASFIGCGLFAGEEDYVDNRPDIENSLTGIKVSAQKLSTDTEYINIYRREYLGIEKDAGTGSEKKLYGPVYNIGILYPSEFDKNNVSYMYEDLYVIKGKQYEYKARYYDSVEDDYYTTNWTDTFQAQYGKDNKEAITFKIGNAYLEYSDSPYPNLRLCNPTTIDGFDKFSSDDFALSLALYTNDETQIFSLEKEFLEGTVSLNLLTFLPSSFYKNADNTYKEIFVKGLVGQKIDPNIYDDGSTKNKRIYWTQPVEISLVQGTQKATSIKFTVNAGADGIDFSIPAEKTSEDTEE